MKLNKDYQFKLHNMKQKKIRYNDSKQKKVSNFTSNQW